MCAWCLCWTAVTSRVFSSLSASIPWRGSRSTEPLTRIKQVLCIRGHRPLYLKTLAPSIIMPTWPANHFLQKFLIS